MSEIQINRKENESFLDWKLRLITYKLEKTVDLDWVEIKDILGLDCSSDHLRKTAYGIYEYKNHFEEKVESSFSNEILDEIEQKRVEMEKEKMRLQDQKREYNKMKRDQARFEHLNDEIVKAIEKVNETKPLNFSPSTIKGRDKEGLVLFSDWHYGSNVENRFNTYNKEVFRERVSTLVSKTLTYGIKNGIRTLHVAQLGDIINGQLHTANRVMSDENIIKQIQIVSEVLAEILVKFAETFEEVKFYNVIGNHGRTISKKEDTGIKENFEYLIAWYLEARLKDIPNLEIVKDEDGVITTEIMGKKIAFVHGNYDRVESVSERLSQCFGYIFNYVFMGHIHHHTEKEKGYFTDIVVNSSMIGADDYSVQKRLVSKPAQKFLILDEDQGIECTYNIKL